MIYLYGASGHAKVIIELAELCALPIGGLIDSNPAIKELLGYRVSLEMPKDISDATRFLISIGNNLIRQKVAKDIKAKFETLVHPGSNLSQRIVLGKGTVVMAGVSVNSSCKIGDHVILNTNCSIDHDCIIGDYAHISPNAALAGNVTVGEGAHIGIGASVIQGITIGSWCTIGAGSVIIRDVPAGAVVVGNPGKIIKYKKNEF